ncbi:MAG: hypothetical protein QOI20_808 [Acidimicrobiaceae bacterium]|jgi:steroid delta-isomerase-like uncharacterized protein|nr:hypothetical protein [Acidimicrobiaceae bacterium]
MGANLKLVDQAISAYNQGELQAFCALYADNAVLSAPDGTYIGRAAITEMWRGTRESFPDAKLTITLTVDDGTCVVSEWTHYAINTGPLTLPDGTTVPATGMPVEISGMDVVEVRNGQIVAHRLYYDNMAVLAQLGLVPAAG